MDRQEYLSRSTCRDELVEDAVGSGCHLVQRARLLVFIHSQPEVQVFLAEL